MNQEQSERKEILQEQLQWTRDQMEILDQMDNKLQEMKRIAEYVVGNDLSVDERGNLNRLLEILKDEYNLLESQKKTIVH